MLAGNVVVAIGLLSGAAAAQSQQLRCQRARGGQNPAKTINGLEAGDTITGTDFPTR
jgi:hypothetical protein